MGLVLGALRWEWSFWGVKGVYFFQVHGAHGAFHAFYDASHGAGDLAHGHGCLDPGCDGVDAAAES